MTNIEDIISSLQEANKSNASRFTLPVSKLKVELLPLTAKHITAFDSSLISTAKEGTYGMAFSRVLRDVLSDILVLPNGKTFNDFTIYDLNYIILKMRESVNPIFNPRDMDDESDDIEINITEMLKRKTNHPKEKNLVKNVSCDNLQVELKLPTFQKSIRYDNMINKLYIENSGDMEMIARESFNNVIIRYVSVIKLPVNNESVTVDFETLSPQEQKKIVSNFSSSTYRLLFDEISELTEPVNELVSIDGVTIPMDQTLFITKEK